MEVIQPQTGTMPMPQQQIITTDLPQNLPNTTPTVSDLQKSNITTYVVYAVMAIVLIVLIYFAYAKFKENAGGNSCSSEQKEGSATLVPDYNLRDEIKSIEKSQSNILKRLSSDVGI